MPDTCYLLVLFVDLNMCVDRNAKHMSARSLIWVRKTYLDAEKSKEDAPSPMCRDVVYGVLYFFVVHDPCDNPTP